MHNPAVHAPLSTRDDSQEGGAVHLQPAEVVALAPTEVSLQL